MPPPKVDLTTVGGTSPQVTDAIAFFDAADQDGNAQVDRKEFFSFLSGFGEEEEEMATSQPALDRFRQYVSSKPAPESEMGAAEQELALTFERLLKQRGEEAEAELTKRSWAWDDTVSQMKEHGVGAESDPNPSLLQQSRKWTWRFGEGEMPRLVSASRSDGYSATRDGAQRFQGLYVLSLTEHTSLSVNCSNLYNELEMPGAWSDRVGGKVDGWAVTVFFRLLSLTKDDGKPHTLLTMRRGGGGDSSGGGGDSERGGSVVIFPNGTLGLQLADEAWPSSWQRRLWLWGDRPKVQVELGCWNLVSICVDLPHCVRIMLNGEIVFELRAPLPTMPKELSAEQSRRAEAAFSQALRSGGPFAIDARQGFELLGGSSAEESVSSSRMESKQLRAFTLWSGPASSAEIRAEHSVYGAWRCPFCSSPAPLPGSEQLSATSEGRRNAIDAGACAFCGEGRVRSQGLIPENPPADWPGRWIVTADNFDELVLGSMTHFYLLLSSEKHAQNGRDEMERNVARSNLSTILSLALPFRAADPRLRPERSSPETQRLAR